MFSFRSHGKLLLSGEYVVLDGAKALAVPTQYGQTLKVEPIETPEIQWKSFDHINHIWFETTLQIDINGLLSTQDNDNAITTRLIQILSEVKALNADFISPNTGYSVTTHLDFNRHWGLGTSSTLINNIALWADVNPYQLLHKTFGGSGYDIACANHETAITYQVGNSPYEPIVEPKTFNPSFKDQLYFVYLNKKQNSRDGIKAYKSLNKVNTATVDAINEITRSLLNTQTLKEFESLLIQHENLISSLIKQPTIQSRGFSDFGGTIKSLGAWGGDFVLVASEKDPIPYFTNKGFQTIIPYNHMIL